MNKHTPGPWGLYYNSMSDVVVRKMLDSGFESHVIARVNSGTYDARLIAAAPDLLESLQDMMPAFESRLGDYENAEWNDCWNKAIAAIAKATGGAA